MPYFITHLNSVVYDILLFYDLKLIPGQALSPSARAFTTKLKIKFAIDNRLPQKKTGPELASLKIRL